MIRAAGVDDLEVVRELRLAALADAPEAFGSTYEREAAFTEAVWRSRLADDRVVTFIAVDGDEPAGLATGAFDATDPTMAHLYSMWVRPANRRRGIAAALVEQVLAWAESSGMEQVQLDVVDGNVAATQLYERHGFRGTGNTVVRDRDGMVEIELIRRLADAPAAGG